MRLTALLMLLSSAAAATPARKESLLYAHCPRESGEYIGTLRAKVLLHRDFLDPALSESENLALAIEHQIRYLWGWYRNDAASHAAVQLVLSAEKSAVEIIEKRQVPYGRDLELPYDTKDKRLKIEDVYTLRAVARKRVRKNDPALLVEYQARVKLALCGRAEDPGTTLRAPLPPDPWLAYWQVPKRLHRPLEYFHSREVTNPCADNDFADLPHPFYYWYDWLPNRHGPDADGRGFDCRKWLTDGRDFSYYDVALTRLGSVASHDFARLRRDLAGSQPLAATIVIGVLDHPVLELNLDDWRARIGSGGGTLSDAAAAARKIWAESKPRERGTGMFLQTLDELRALLDVEKFTSKVEDGFLTVQAQGRLRKSGRALRLRAHLGMTDIFGPKPPRHWSILRRALAEDHLILYWGHSGIGENFRLAQIEKNLNLPHADFAAEFARSPVRLIAFISCYSYMYFGQDLLEAGAERLAGGLFVFTGMGPTKKDGPPLAALDLVDRVLEPGNTNGRIDRLPMLYDDEFWLIKDVEGKK